MARLRQAGEARVPVVRTKEEAAAIPSDQEIEIVLPGEPRPEDQNKDASDGGDTERKKEPPARRTASPPPQNFADDNDNAADSLAVTRERERKRREQMEQRAATAEANAANLAKENEELRGNVETTQMDSITSALAAAQAESAAAQGELATASAAGDHAAIAKATQKMMRAESQITNLEAGKTALEQQTKERKEKPAPALNNNIESMLAQMPNLMEAEREWIRDHPDALLDRTNQSRLQVAFIDAQKKGLKRGSDEYFQFFNDRLGYADESREDAPVTDIEDEPPPPPRTRVAAPVSRAAGPARGNNGDRPSRVVLSPNQREAARISGVDEVTYAQGVVRLAQMKRDGFYQERG